MRELTKSPLVSVGLESLTNSVKNANLLNCLRALFTVMAALAFSMSSAIAKETDKASLSERQRAFIPIAAFTAQGDMEQLKLALEAGMDSGLSISETKEILVHSYAYVGFPRALNGINSYMSVLEDRQRRGVEDASGPFATSVPQDFDRLAYGHETRNALVGRDISNRKSGYAAFTPVIDRFLVKHLFADIFYRDILTHQDRELVTISMLSAMPSVTPQLTGHLGIAKRVGFSDRQLAEFTDVLETEVDPDSAGRARAILGIDPTKDMQTMKQSQLDISRAQPAITASEKNFTGHVTIESRFASGIADHYGGATVNFAAGARTNWHSHPMGQTLIIISGEGLVQSDGGEIQSVLPGDVIWIPPHVKHWHGASPTLPMSHIAISEPKEDVRVVWMEAVTDEQYHQSDAQDK